MTKIYEAQQRRVLARQRGFNFAASRPGLAGLSTQLRIVVFSLLVTPALFNVPPLWAAVFAPMVLASRDSQTRAVQIALTIGALLTWLGAQGEYAYMGVAAIQSSTFRYCLVFTVLISFSVHLAQYIGTSWRASSNIGVLIPRSIHLGFLFFACGLLAIRLSAGIPLLEGNAARLQAVAGLSPIMGIALGAIVISSAYLRSGTSVAVILLQILMVVLTLGTASRLLVVAVVLGVLTGHNEHIVRGLSISRWISTAATSLVAVVVALVVYDLRTSTDVESSNAVRAANVGGLAGVFNDLFGTSFYLSGRNGLAVSQIMTSRGLDAPHGFILGGLQKSSGLFHSVEDPERWLTRALGFSIDSVGAIATPIWSGSLSSFGFVGGLLVAALLGLALASYCRYVPGSAIWIAVATVFSFYGSYAVSAQFLSSSVVLLLAHLLAKGMRCPEYLEAPPDKNGDSRFKTR